MPSGWRLVLAALATFRLTWMFMFSDGPGKCWFKLKVAIGCYDHNENGQLKSGIAEWFNCPYCVALGMAVLPAILSFHPCPAGDLLLIWFGITGMVTVLIRWRQWENG